MHALRSGIKVRWQGAVLPLLLFGLWWLSAEYKWISPTVLVSPARMLAALGDPAIRDTLVGGIEASAVRLAEGAILGIAIGVFVGFALALSGLAERLFGPSLNAVRQIAMFAWIPLLTAWFGNGDLGKVLFVAFGSFFPVAMGICEGVKAVPSQLKEVGRVYCLSPWLQFRMIILPAATPAIITSLQLSLLLSWVSTIGAEYLMGGMAQGVGTFVMMGQDQVRPDVILLGVTVIALSGFVFNKLVRSTSRYLLRWRQI
ncbi:MAG: ABC transporter permease [Pseudomonadota bacterium]